MGETMIRHALTAAAAALLAIAASGCGDLGVVTYDYNLAEQRVLGSGNVGSPLPDGPLSYSTTMDSQDTDRAKSVRVAQVRLWITATASSPADQDNFDFLDWVEVYAAPIDRPAERVLLASRYIIPKDAEYFDLVVEESVELLDLVQNGLQITTMSEGSAPSDDTTFAGRVTLEIDVL